MEEIMKIKKEIAKKLSSIILALCLTFSATGPYIVKADENANKVTIGADYNKDNISSYELPKTGGVVSVEINTSLLGISDDSELDKISMKFFRTESDWRNKFNSNDEDKVIEKYNELDGNQPEIAFIEGSKKIENGKFVVQFKFKGYPSIKSDRYFKTIFKNTENDEKTVDAHFTVTTKETVENNNGNNSGNGNSGSGTSDSGNENVTNKSLSVISINTAVPDVNGENSANFMVSTSKGDEANLRVEVLNKDGEKVTEGINTNISSSNSSNSSNFIDVKVSFPNNASDEDLKYTVKFKLDGTDKEVIKEVTVKSSGQSVSTSDLIKGVKKNDYSVSSNGGTIEIELETSESIQNQSISVADRISGKVFNISGVTGDGTTRKIKVDIPKSQEDSTTKYELVFTGMGKETALSSYQKSPVVNVNIDNTSVLEPIVDSVKVRLPIMTYSGGENSLTIKGSNLDPSNVSVVVEKKEGDNYVDVTSQVFPDGRMYGNSAILTGQLSVPQATKDEEYRIKLTFSNKNEAELIFYQKESGSSEKLGDFLPRMTYIRNKNEIVVRYFFDVSAVNKDTLKNGIKLKLYKNKEVKSLSNNDSVEVSGTDLVIKLGEEINEKELDSGAKVILNERVIKDAKNVENKANEYLIYNNISVLNDYKFIEGEVLEHNGGKVKIKLIGENLNSKNVKVKVQKNGKYDNEGTRPEIKDVKVTENNDSGKTMDIEFNLPENTSDLTETYVVLLSLDGGISYASDQKLELYDRTKKIIPAVLPNGKALNDKTLSFMRIHSYGTVGGNAEVPDTTYTETPIGQESKKTFVDLYGTNLEKSKTKVRLVDENGIIWYPVNESVHDSGDRVIMINLDGTGIEGNGNNQKLEVILPRGYSGDMTFTYQVAIDGVNFDEKTVVRARIIDDKEGIKPTFAEKIRTANVKYQTDDGKDVVASRDIKVMKQLPLRITEIRPLEIDGYKYVGIKDYKKDMSKIERLAELEKLEKEGELTDEQKKEMDTLKIDIRLREREELNEPLGERNEVVFLYEKVDDKKTEGENNSGSSAGSSNSSSTGIPKIALNDETKKEKNKTVERISGDDRYDTSYNIARRAVKSANRVIVVSGENFADALTSAPLAFSKDSVILLSSDGNVKKLKEEINRLNPREVIISGGSNSVSDAVENAIKGDSKAIRISGNDRYKTAAKNAEKAIIENGNKKKVIIVDGRNYPDAISIAPYAAKNGLPILLANGNKLSDEQMSVIKKYGIDEAIIIGGQNSIGSSIDGLFNKSTRVAGKDRYETSRLVAKKYFGDARKIVVASGRNFADALSVSYYAAQTNSPVVLTDGVKNDDNLLKMLKDFNFEELIAVGGVNSIKESILSNIK
ncbi:cell wall-binding repeat-containing protein [Peptostreptococcus anaerobius]|uniref:Cell wall-binding repeat-containing protein n=2 Tax=Peptostreptococcus porci TaxID=2652282 RepID=A0A6N7X081_9FIRM|nr:cell wall-binding repeat-containing protein [Peptostreptococcus porci]